MRPKVRLRGGDQMRRGKVGPTLRCSQNWTEALSGKRIQMCARQLASNDEFDHWQRCFGKAQRPFSKRQGIRIRDYSITRTRPSLQRRGQVRPLVRRVRKLILWWWSLLLLVRTGFESWYDAFAFRRACFYGLKLSL